MHICKGQCAFAWLLSTRPQPYQVPSWNLLHDAVHFGDPLMCDDDAPLSLQIVFWSHILRISASGCTFWFRAVNWFHFGQRFCFICEGEYVQVSAHMFFL